MEKEASPTGLAFFLYPELQPSVVNCSYVQKDTDLLIAFSSPVLPFTRPGGERNRPLTLHSIHTLGGNSGDIAGNDAQLQRSGDRPYLGRPCR